MLIRMVELNVGTLNVKKPTKISNQQDVALDVIIFSTTLGNYLILRISIEFSRDPKKKKYFVTKSNHNLIYFHFKRR